MRYIKILFLLCFVLNQHTSSGQTGTFKDQRDGKEYKTIKVGGLVWFAEDLKYETEDGFILKEDGVTEHVFYSNQKLESLCPYPFRMPTSKEWIRAIEQLYDVGKIAHTKKKENKTIAFDVGLDSVLISNQKLNFQMTGWVEGGEHVFFGTTTYWLNKNKKKNFHFHFGDAAFIEHTHMHNIEDIMEGTRKFLVRCVCENSKLKKQMVTKGQQNNG